MCPAAGFFRDFYISCTVCPNVFVGVTDYLAQFQLLAHTAIAVNRFTCFGSELIHERLWEGRGLKLIVFGLFVASFALMAYEIPFKAHYIRTRSGSLNGIVLDDVTLDTVSKATIVKASP
ncbi:hypothetical protein AAVH_14121 [Aphelenchoides avenae]|nr:hypothetical protein AAVH_14121 [Aphelenchus avenae]